MQDVSGPGSHRTEHSCAGRHALDIKEGRVIPAAPFLSWDNP
jgi:hypothetical protein